MRIYKIRKQKIARCSRGKKMRRCSMKTDNHLFISNIFTLLVMFSAENHCDIVFI